MDDPAIGRLFRELRVWLGWPQRLIAAKAGSSQAAYSEIERGLIDTVSVGRLRKVASTLEVLLAIEPRWLGAAVDRLLSSRHASMTEEWCESSSRPAGARARRRPSDEHLVRG